MYYILLRRKNIWKHATMWLAYGLLQQISTPFTGTLGEILLANSIIIIQLASTFYFISFIIYQLLYERSKALMILAVIAFFIPYVFIYNKILKTIFPYFNISSQLSNSPNYVVVIQGIWVYFLTVAASWAFFLNHFNLYKLKEQDKKKKTILNRELAFLKSQFNSHLTFNFFNYCYSGIYKKSEATALAIERFSDMLRYSLETGSKKQKPLSEEIEYMKNYIEIQKLISSNVSVEVNLDCDTKNLFVVPYILTSLLEEAFVHGLINSKSNPIAVNLSQNNDLIEFHIEYASAHCSDKKPVSNHHANIYRSLDLFYSDKSKLEVQKYGTINLRKLTIHKKALLYTA